jgi:MFS family permease
VRARIEEPAAWQEAQRKAATHEGPRPGNFGELFRDPRWRKSALLGMLLAAVGLGTFWSVTVAGQDLARDFLLRQGIAPAIAAARAKFAYGNVQALGGGLGMLAFGPLAVRFGRRKTFVLYHVASLIVVPLACFAQGAYGLLLALLPFYGFFTLGIHAGYAVYFPELFPNHLRSTGTGFCFNGGRLLASSMLIFSGWLKAVPGLSLREAIALMSLLFLLGPVIITFLPETKNRALPA